jgi:hypothetical protein
MAVSSDDVEALVGSFVIAIERMSAKERQEKPYNQFGERFNEVLCLAKEALPTVDVRLWPKPLEITNPHFGPGHAVATYGEIETYARQIQSIVVQYVDPTPGPMRG